jgi:hypothetical protein
MECPYGHRVVRNFVKPISQSTLTSHMVGKNERHPSRSMNIERINSPHSARHSSFKEGEQVNCS